ncbi:expressed unknown protein [Seminavis robusta]|uniref:Uncharacterized protein n=1 Tax=Seminavis robusta TaxID=568900 RepID=A0A9N8DKX7_9STRA|nr:expressed unknown protein [Seminavis robusta]|eukprot:Sro136_g064240.1 n/a (171) ;mRNA; r:95967-96479
MRSLQLFCVAFWVASTTAFTTTPQSQFHIASSALSMAKLPTYDKKIERWSPASEEESAANAYDAIGTLLRQGPKAYFTRVSDADLYDQACLKFMAQEKCSYQMAQGNLDRMNENMQDWMFERMEAEKKGRKIDYVKLDMKDVTLTVVWGGFITLVLGRVLFLYFTGGYDI